MQEQNVGGIPVTQARWHRTKLKGACMDAWWIHRVCSQHTHVAHRTFQTRKAESHFKPCSAVPVLLLYRHGKNIKAASKESYFVLTGSGFFDYSKIILLLCHKRAVPMRLLSLSTATIIFPSPKPSEPSAPQEKVLPAIITVHFPYILVKPFIFPKASNTLT